MKIRVIKTGNGSIKTAKASCPWLIECPPEPRK